MTTPNQPLDPNRDRLNDGLGDPVARDGRYDIDPADDTIVVDREPAVTRPVRDEVVVERTRTTSAPATNTAGSTGVEVDDRSGLPGWLKLLGGLLTIGSMFLPWITKKVDDGWNAGNAERKDVDMIRNDVNGVDTDLGKWVLVLGIILALMGLLWALKAMGRAKWIPGVGLLSSLGILGIALMNWTKIGDWVKDNWPDSIDQANQSLTHANVGLGTWIALLGGLLGLIGSILALMTRREVYTRRDAV